MAYVPDSVVILQLSKHGIVSDASNGLEWGVAAPSGATGQEVAINALFAAASAAAASAGVMGAGIKVVWDVAVAIGAPIFLYSNFTIECPNHACGAIVRAGANCPVFMVKGMDANMGGGAYTGSGATATQKTFGKFDPAHSGAAHPEYYRVFDPAFVNANNIMILGGTWNGYYAGQTTQPYGTGGSLPFIVASNIGYTSIMHFFGVNYLTLRDVRAFNGTHFGLYFCNVANVVLDNCDVDQLMDANYGSDAFHFGGPCNNIRMTNPRTHCADDNIALNADDLAVNTTEGIAPGVNWQCAGAITDVWIKNHIIWNGRENVQGWGGICFRSTASLIDRIFIDGVSGTPGSWAIWFPQVSLPQAPLLAGTGNCGHISLKNLSLDLINPYLSPAVIYVNSNVQLLEIENRTRIGAQAGPDIVIEHGVTIIKLRIKGYFAYQPTGSINNNEIALYNKAVIASLDFEGTTIRDGGVSQQIAALIYNDPTGSIGQARIDVDASSITNIVSNQNAIQYLRMDGVHRTSNGGSPVVNSGTIGSYNPGAGTSPLISYSSGLASYSGTAPALVNSYGPDVIPVSFRFNASGNGNASVPNAAGLNTSTWVDLRAQVNFSTWNSQTDDAWLVFNYNGGPGGYALGLNTVGEIILLYYDPISSSAKFVPLSLVTIPAPTNTNVWLRGIANATTGTITVAGGDAVPAGTARFYYSLDNVTYSQFGQDKTITQGGMGSAVSVPILLGNNAATGSPTYNNGRVIHLKAYPGSTTAALDVDFSKAAAGAASFTAVTGQTVTINSPGLIG